MDMQACFPQPLKELLCTLKEPVSDIRLFANGLCSVKTAQGERVAPCTLTPDELYETVQRLCNRRLRISPETTGEGFITLRGGHRMGLCGRVTCEGNSLTLREIGSVCIRVAHEVKGSGACAAALAQSESGLCGVLIAGNPGSGKTTLMRDAVRLISDAGTVVGLCDERGEVAACVDGTAQLDVGCRTHVLDGCPKAKGLRWLLRALGPDMLAMDELYGAEECAAVHEAAACGVPVIATAHAGSVSELLAREGVTMLLRESVFSYVLFLKERSVIAQWHARDVLEASCCAR